jgi:hypothetical protein
MRLPGMTSELSLHSERSLHRATVEQAFTKDRSTIVPAQIGPVCCAERTGPCTTPIGVGFIGTRPPSTATLAGFTASCTGDFQFPVIRVCRNANTGSVVSVSRRCDFCLW